MKISIAQINSISGDIGANIKKHLLFIQESIHQSADLILFPELSITNYETALAQRLATSVDDSRFAPFQYMSDSHQLTICIGVPIKTLKGVQIGMLVFQANKSPQLYAKQLLHEDELPFFVAGQKDFQVTFDDLKLSFGICYESLQTEHLKKAVSIGSNLYLASVAKPIHGIQKAYLHFPKFAKQFKIPILMANSVGKSDNFIAAGSSAIWNSKGQLLADLNEFEEGLLSYCTKTETINKWNFS